MKVFNSISLFLLICVFSLKAEDRQEASHPEAFSLSAECEPISSVAGCVNVLTGSFFQVETDLFLPTVEPFYLTRYYDSSNIETSFIGFGYGCHLPLIACKPELKYKHYYALIQERQGFFVPYRNEDQSDVHSYRVDSRIADEGYGTVNKLDREL